MLNRIEWDKPKTDVFSLDSLIAWLETMPGDGEYCFLDNGECLLHQYFSAVGMNPTWVGGVTFKYVLDGIERRKPLSEEFRSIARGRPRTFGAALSRARSLTTQKAG